MKKGKNILSVLFVLFFLIISVIQAEEEYIYKGDSWNLFNYLRIEAALKRYRQIGENGGWPVLPANIILRKGDTADEIKILRERLAVTADLHEKNPLSQYFFDEKLEEAVLKFQARHGLKEDGIVGPQTIAALNIPVDRKIRELELAKERVFNLFDGYIERYILVNIPEYKLRVIENGKQVLEMKVIVGKKTSRTPVFKGSIEYLVFNPTWKIPVRKAVNEVLPLIKNDPGYLERKNIMVFDSWNANRKELRPDEVNWAEYNYSNFNLMLEQKAGPDNELGRVKFIFPNPYMVYLHDTPHRELFAYQERTFSSGCIRAERALELAVYCLKKDPEWSQEKTMEIVERGELFQVNLTEHIPIVIVYWTAWVDEEGTVHFRDDIYNLNK
ncbi:MAG: L,D-transpeptidase family protein [Halanaerobiaceae bacterium]|nr:L,D-transpeptidase family protein [Halanaerobiaceae bacterium]